MLSQEHQQQLQNNISLMASQDAPQEDVQAMIDAFKAKYETQNTPQPSGMEGGAIGAAGDFLGAAAKTGFNLVSGVGKVMFESPAKILGGGLTTGLGIGLNDQAMIKRGVKTSTDPVVGLGEAMASMGRAPIELGQGLGNMVNAGLLKGSRVMGAKWKSDKEPGELFKSGFKDTLRGGSKLSAFTGAGAAVTAGLAGASTFMDSEDSGESLASRLGSATMMGGAVYGGFKAPQAASWLAPKLGPKLPYMKSNFYTAPKDVPGGGPPNSVSVSINKKFTPAQIEKFQKMTISKKYPKGQTPGEWSQERGRDFVGGDRRALTAQATRIQNVKGSLDDGLTIVSKFEPPAKPAWAKQMLQEAHTRFGDRKFVSGDPWASKDAAFVKCMVTKVGKDGSIEMRPMNIKQLKELARIYQRNNKMGYLRENNAKAVTDATDLDYTSRDYLAGVADKYRFAKPGEMSYRQMSKEIQQTMEVMNMTAKAVIKAEKLGGLDFSDKLLLMGTMFEPNTAIALAVKKFIGSDWLKGTINRLQTPAEPAVGLPKADLAGIELKGQFLQQARQHASEAAIAKAAQLKTYALQVKNATDFKNFMKWFKEKVVKDTGSTTLPAGPKGGVIHVAPSAPPATATSGNFPQLPAASKDIHAAMTPQPPAGPPIRPNVKPMSAEQMIETSGDWKPGVRAEFDKALMHGSPAQVKALLKDVPVAYQKTFKAEIAKKLAAPNEFHAAIQDSVKKYPDHLSSYTPEEYAQMNVFLDKSKSAGYAIKADGELVSVFNKGAKGNGAKMVQEALDKGANHLDTLQGPLVDYYKKFGFEPYATEANWVKGKPDVVFMKLPTYADPKAGITGSVPGLPVPVLSARRLANQQIKDRKLRARINRALNPPSRTNRPAP